MARTRIFDSFCDLLCFRRDQSNDDEALLGILRDDDEILKDFLLRERALEVLNSDLTMSSESGVGHESFDASRLEGDDNVRFVKSSHFSAEDVSDLDAVRTGGGLVEVRGGLSGGGDDSLTGFVDVDDSNGNHSSDGEHSSEIVCEPLTITVVQYLLHTGRIQDDSRSFLGGNESTKSTEEIDNHSSIHDLRHGSVRDDSDLSIGEGGDDRQLRSDESSLQSQDDTVLLRIGRVDLLATSQPIE